MMEASGRVFLVLVIELVYCSIGFASMWLVRGFSVEIANKFWQIGMSEQLSNRHDLATARDVLARIAIECVL
jgi:hypothetical protein